MRENIVTHYLPLRNDPNNVLHEKGIDVWLALEAYEMSIYKHFDIIVLVACDGDYVPLVRKLNTLGTHVMLISWDFDYYNENGQIRTTRTSQQLLDEVFHPVSMHQVIDGQAQDEFVKNLFVFDRDNNYTNYTPNTNTASAAPREPTPMIKKDAVYTHTLDDSDSVDNDYGEYEEIDSVILSVKEGYGFIEDRAANNVFFHYNTVENADFNELKPGMKVRYLRVEDAEQSKIAGAPRYRAVKVFIVD
jgi:cold shock CspA family protein